MDCYAIIFHGVSSIHLKSQKCDKQFLPFEQFISGIEKSVMRSISEFNKHYYLQISDYSSNCICVEFTLTRSHIPNDNQQTSPKRQILPQRQNLATLTIKSENIKKIISFLVVSYFCILFQGLTRKRKHLIDQNHCDVCQYCYCIAVRVVPALLSMIKNVIKLFLVFYSYANKSFRKLAKRHFFVNQLYMKML